MGSEGCRYRLQPSSRIGVRERLHESIEQLNEFSRCIPATPAPMLLRSKVLSSMGRFDEALQVRPEHVS